MLGFSASSAGNGVMRSGCVRGSQGRAGCCRVRLGVALELFGPHGGIEAAAVLQEALVPPSLDCAACNEHNDLVACGDRREPMSDAEGAAPLRSCL
mmetsp:Transcript_46576/g.92937  ORF Transcript_46576/g.92937 Transcript_46576/m.92937 type:complete len:96 (+) Transcript_46576:252-539(+)